MQGGIAPVGGIPPPGTGGRHTHRRSEPASEVLAHDGVEEDHEDEAPSKDEAVDGKGVFIGDHDGLSAG